MLVGFLLNFLVAVIVLFIFMKIGEIALGLFKAPVEAVQILRLICLLILLLWLVEIVGVAHLGFPLIRYS